MRVALATGLLRITGPVGPDGNLWYNLRVKKEEDVYTVANLRRFLDSLELACVPDDTVVRLLVDNHVRRIYGSYAFHPQIGLPTIVAKPVRKYKPKEAKK